MWEAIPDIHQRRNVALLLWCRMRLKANKMDGASTAAAASSLLSQFCTLESAPVSPHSCFQVLDYLE